MNTTKTPKLHLAINIKAFNPAMQAIYFDPCGYAVATNSHILVAIPINELNSHFNADFSPLMGKYMSVDTYKLMLKKGNYVVNITPEKIELSCGIYKSLELGKYVTWQNVIPNIDKDKTEAPNLLGINPSLLFNLSEALGVDFLELYNPAEDKNTKALICSAGNSIGLIMPVYIGNELEIIENIYQSVENLQGELV